VPCRRLPTEYPTGSYNYIRLSPIHQTPGTADLLIVSTRAVAGQKRTLIKVLVADSTALVNEGLTVMLSEMDCISVFGCVQESSKVLALVEAVQPDVVLLDLNAPGTGGLKMLVGVKQGCPQATVIVLSQYDLLPVRQACLNAGADYFFEKTAAFDRLREVLIEIVNRRNAPRRRC
jgi:two-component system, NarL family, response regulator DevR